MLNDEQFRSLYETREVLSFEAYCKLYFNPFEPTDNFNEDFNPDLVYESALQHNAKACDYYDLSDVKKIDSKCDGEFLLLSLNICSISKHLEEFTMDFGMIGFDIVAFCETRLSNEISQLFSLPNYDMFSNHRNTRGGGVALYAKDIYRAVQIPELSVMEDSLETVFIDFSVGSSNYLVGNVYRPPAADFDKFLIILSDLLKYICTHYKSHRVFISGDFNVDLLKVNDSRYHLRYYSMMSSYGYMPKILRPTRVTERSATLIDQIWTNDLKSVSESGIVLSNISDHFPVFARVKCPNRVMNNDNVYTTVNYRLNNQSCREGF
jgi:exonuclease III